MLPLPAAAHRMPTRPAWPARGGLPTCAACTSCLPQIIERAKDKSDPFRLMGFGHRVYRTYDPRAKLMRQVTYRVLEKLGRK